MKKIKKKNEILPGSPIPIRQFTSEGNFNWSEPIADEQGMLQVAKLLGLELLAMRFQPDTRKMIFFPAGAIIYVLKGKLLVADRSTPGKGEDRKFGYPMHLLQRSEAKSVSPDTYVNLLSMEKEAVFILFQPGGMQFSAVIH